MSGAFAAQLSLRNTPQFGVYQRNKAVERPPITASQLVKQYRDAPTHSNVSNHTIERLAPVVRRASTLAAFGFKLPYEPKKSIVCNTEYLAQKNLQIGLASL
jgi:hypothetical protein